MLVKLAIAYNKFAHAFQQQAAADLFPPVQFANGFAIISQTALAPIGPWQRR